jgi:hypothetical protein
VCEVSLLVHVNCSGCTRYGKTYGRGVKFVFPFLAVWTVRVHGGVLRDPVCVFCFVGEMHTGCPLTDAAAVAVAMDCSALPETEIAVCVALLVKWSAASPHEECACWGHGCL